MSGDKDIDDEIAGQDDLMDEDLDAARGEEDEFADEDWDSYDEEGASDEGGDDGAPKKKDNSRFNKMVIGATVMIGLCVLAFMMLTGGPAQTPAGGQTPGVRAAQNGQGLDETARQRLNSASLADSAPTTQRDVVYGRNREDANAAPEQEEVPVDGGLLNNPSEVRKIEEYRAQLEEDLVNQDAAAEAVAVAEDDGQDLPAATPEIVNQDPPMPAPMAQDSVLTPLPSSGEDVPSVGLPRAQDLAIADVTEPAPADVPVDAAPVESAFAETDAVPVVEAAPAVVVSDAVSVAASGDVGALTEKVETLQGALDTQTEKVKELESTVQQLERALESRASAPVREVVPVKRKSSSSAAAAKKAAAPVRWVLKSAQPGQAMVSKAGENEMRNITVGDNLRGIGRVTKIYQSPLGWVVEGTNGRILQ